MLAVVEFATYICIIGLALIGMYSVCMWVNGFKKGRPAVLHLNKVEVLDYVAQHKVYKEMCKIAEGRETA